MKNTQTKAQSSGRESRANSKTVYNPNSTMSAGNPADLLLSRLESVQPHGGHARGPRSWIAQCPSHNDRHPSLSIREFSDGSLSVKCFAHQCSTTDVLAAIGLHPSELFPRERADDYERHQERPRLPPAPWRDVIRALHHHLRVVAIGAAEMSAKRSLPEEDYATIGNAASYIKAVLAEVCNDA